MCRYTEVLRIAQTHAKTKVIQVKDKKTNENPLKSDSWSALQSELGLLSSPVEHEQIAVVKATDPRDATPQTGETPWENLNHEASPTALQKETVVVNIDSPVISENDSDSWDVSSSQNANDLFGFDDLGDCDIPKNAFVTPKKTVASRERRMIAQPLTEPPPALSERPPFAAETEALDLLMTDELPTALWQPRKPASVAKTKLLDVPSFSGTMLRESGLKDQERQSEFRGQEALPKPVDDLARHSSGKKRQDRGKGRQGKSDDRRPSESSNSDWREGSFRVSENQNPRQRKESALQASSDDPVFDGDAGESIFHDTAWELKISKGKNRKSGKSSCPGEAVPCPFDDAVTDRNSRNSFAANLNGDVDYDKDWLEEGGKMEKTAFHVSRRNPKRNPPAEPKPEPAKGKQSVFDKDKAPVRYSREKREPVSLPRPQRRAESPVAESPAQKITVASWDDAVRDIIEKNMQRRPVAKSDRQDNSRGRRH